MTEEQARTTALHRKQLAASLVGMRRKGQRGLAVRLLSCWHALQRRLARKL